MQHGITWQPVYIHTAPVQVYNVAWKIPSNWLCRAVCIYIPHTAGAGEAEAYETGCWVTRKLDQLISPHATTCEHIRPDKGMKYVS